MSLDQIMAYLPYVIAGLAVVVAVAHRRGKDVPVLSGLLDALMSLKNPARVPVDPVKPVPAPDLPADHPLIRQLLDMLKEALSKSQPK